MTDTFATRMLEALDEWPAHVSSPTSATTGGGAIGLTEACLREMTGTTRALLVSSGTAALRAALLASGVRPGTEVILSAFDWPAASAAVRSLGAMPVFADVDSTATLSAREVARFLTPATEAVIATHLFGNPADIPAIREAVDHKPVTIIEDAAHALGASLNDNPVGSMGDIACFSFGPGKTVDAGEGGAITTKSNKLWQLLAQLTQHPMRQQLLGVEASVEPQVHARIHPAAAILAVHQISRIADRLKQSSATARLLLERAAHFTNGSLCPLAVVPGSSPTWYRIAAVLSNGKSTDHVINRLSGAGVYASPSPIQAQPGSGTSTGDTWPNAAWLSEQIVLLDPTSPICHELGAKE